MLLEAHVIGRICLAAALGAVTGLEREASDQPAGLRTHMTVAIGAALFGVISTVGFDEFQTTQQATNIQFDVTRVASQVVVGIGFLGAGLIFRRGTTVHNLTTAGSLWVVAAIGLACGVGDFGPALVATAALLVGLALLRWPRQWIRDHVAQVSEPVRIVLQDDVPDSVVVQALHELDGVDIRQLGIEKDQGAFVIAANVRARPNVSLREQLSGIARRDDVRGLQLGAGPQ